jgi:hypothetical protein
MVEKTAFRTFDALSTIGIAPCHSHCSCHCSTVPTTHSTALARARAAYATALARALSHLRGRSGILVTQGVPPPDRHAPHGMAGAQRRPRGAEMQMRDGPGGSNVARSEYNTRRNESD